ncbi:MAG: hypothetical protein AAGD05_06860 [Bacteroidota bacterium]
MKKIIHWFCCLSLGMLLSCNGGTPQKEGQTNPPTESPAPASDQKENTAPPVIPSESNAQTPSVPEGASIVPGKISQPDDPQIVPAQPENTEGECIYVDYKGLAKINAIKEAPADADNCPNAILVEFSFGPINQSDIKRYKYTLFKDSEQYLTLHGGMNPSQEWLNRNGITVGTILQCSRKELFQGDCTHVVFEFSEIDTNPKEKCL